MYEGEEGDEGAKQPGSEHYEEYGYPSGYMQTAVALAAAAAAGGYPLPAGYLTHQL